jgi:hypothetical protein
MALRGAERFRQWVFQRSNADGVSDPTYRNRLRKIAQRRFANPIAAVDDLLARLGSEGCVVCTLITKWQPETNARANREIAVGHPPGFAPSLSQ